MIAIFSKDLFNFKDAQSLSKDAFNSIISILIDRLGMEASEERTGGLLFSGDSSELSETIALSYLLFLYWRTNDL